jgi:hypothetical protein
LWVGGEKLCERKQGFGTKYVLLQESIAFGTQPEKDCNEGRIVMQGENRIFHDRVANSSSFLVSFLLLLLLHVQMSFIQQHIYLLWGHRPYTSKTVMLKYSYLSQLSLLHCSVLKESPFTNMGPVAQSV